MLAKELAAKLMEHPDRIVMILDEFNGGGYPREINLGPTTKIIKQTDAEECCDCESIVGVTVTVLGFGCY